MCKLGVEEWLVSAVMSMYTGAKTAVRTVYGNCSSFEAKVCMHLSPMLFVIVMEAISREFRAALPWELLYADDLIVIAEIEQDLIKRLNEWKNNVENRGKRVNMNTRRPASADRTARRQFQAVFPVITSSFPTNVIAHLHALSMDLTVGRTVGPIVDSTVG